MWRITLTGCLVAVGCWHAPTMSVGHGASALTPRTGQPGVLCARPEWRVRLRWYMSSRPAAARKPPGQGLCPRGAADGRRHRAPQGRGEIAGLLGAARLCPRPKSSPSPDAGPRRACMEARGYQVPWVNRAAEGARAVLETLANRGSLHVARIKALSCAAASSIWRSGIKSSVRPSGRS